MAALKEKIASVTGVLSGRQRLTWRGIVLEDDQLLFAHRIFAYFSFSLVSKFFEKIYHKKILS